jgi:hypothetical protein
MTRARESANLLSQTATGNMNLSGILTATSVTETVYTLATSGTIALNSANGSIQTCSASGTVTFTDSLTAGQSIVLHVERNLQTINMPTMTWVTSSGNSAPAVTEKDVFALWKISTTLYGAYVGSYV